jgi:hypothetical protein
LKNAEGDILHHFHQHAAQAKGHQYGFVVAPGADSQVIRLAFEGAWREKWL